MQKIIFSSFDPQLCRAFAVDMLPEEAIQANIEAMKKNDFNILLKVMPEAEMNSSKTPGT